VIVVCDSTILIGLAKIGRLDLLFGHGALKFLSFQLRFPFSLG
jgi:hypothetical protein